MTVLISKYHMSQIYVPFHSDKKLGLNEAINQGIQSNALDPCLHLVSYTPSRWQATWYIVVCWKSEHWLSLSCLFFRASPPMFSMWASKHVSHIQTFFPTPENWNLGDCKYVGGRLLITIHLDQSNHLPNQRQQGSSQ
jgi:hypothetical protein